MYGKAARVWHMARAFVIVRIGRKSNSDDDLSYNFSMTILLFAPGKAVNYERISLKFPLRCFY